MLRPPEIKRVLPWYRAILFPVSLSEALVVMIPGGIIGLIAALVLGEPLLFVICCLLSYTGLLMTGRLIAKYEAVLHDEEQVKYVVNLLDRTPALERRQGFHWHKRTFWMPDTISIREEKPTWVVCGRRFDILKIVAALKQGFRNYGGSALNPQDNVQHAGKG